jgi:hypothetical protein
VGKSKQNRYFLFWLPHEGLARDDLACDKLVKRSTKGFLGVIMFAGYAEDIIIDDLYACTMLLPGELRRIEDYNSYGEKE